MRHCRRGILVIARRSFAAAGGNEQQQRGGNDREARQTVMRLVTQMGLHPIDAGLAFNARVVESLTALLIGLNIRHKVQGSGVRLTGLPG